MADRPAPVTDLAWSPEQAPGRAALYFGDEPGGSARERNRPLLERMEALGVESGRLGSERADVADG